MEFALLLPLIIALIFGVVEAGWTLEQRHDARADANDLARIAAINFSEGSISDFDTTLGDACDAVGLRDEALVAIELPDGSDGGDRVIVTVTNDLVQVTGFFGMVLDGKKVSSSATAVMEQDANFEAVPGTQCDGTVVVTPTVTPVPTATPTPVPAATATPTAVPTVGTNCTVPDFSGVKKNDATDEWTNAGFTGGITFQSGPGNYTIAYQSQTAGNSIACSSTIEVGP